MNKLKFKPCRCGHGTTIHAVSHFPKRSYPCNYPGCACKDYRPAKPGGRATGVGAVGLLLVCGVLGVVLVGCRSNRRRVVLVTDQPWPIGEARSCSFDGKYNEMHCFPPQNLSVPKHKYIVNADFDKPIRFDNEQWAYDITCRLDSFDHATLPLAVMR